MNIQKLLDPIVEGGIHSTNFFNGRRLTAEDLIREKRANRQHERLLGQAIGEGVVYGLEVGLPSGQAAGGTTLEIQKGLAINRNGDALYLPDKVNIPLIPPSDDESILKAVFTECAKMPPVEYPSNTGVYVVLIRPATDLSGNAPMSSIPDDGSIIGCGRSELVEGVQFRVVKMDLNGPVFDGLSEGTKAKLLELSAKTDDKSVSMFKNIVAHACFGTEEVKRFVEDPFGGNNFSNYGAIDKLRSLDEGSKYKIRDFDIPLSIFRWTQGEIQFVDIWAVRRISHGLSPMKNWPAIVTRRRLAESEARFFQFQGHLQRLVQNHTEPRSIKAADYFYYLPPAGFIKLRRGISTGLVPDIFFEALPHRQAPEFFGGYDEFIEGSPQFIDSSLVEAIVGKSYRHQPISLLSNEDESSSGKRPDKEMVWLYYPWQHIAGIRKGEEIEHYLLFTAAHMPSFGIARFDVDRWDFSNYARCCE